MPVIERDKTLKKLEDGQVLIISKGDVAWSVGNPFLTNNSLLNRLCYKMIFAN